MSKAFEITVEVSVMVQNYEQAAKIFDAVESGYVEHLIKDKVLYGGVITETTPVKDNHTEAEWAVPVSSAISIEKAKEAQIELKSSLDTTDSGIRVLEEKPKTERKKGALGGRRFIRSGR